MIRIKTHSKSMKHKFHNKNKQAYWVAKDKYELALHVLDFLSTEAGQQPLFAANIGGISRVKFVAFAPQPSTEDIEEVINSGHYVDFSKLRADMMPVLSETFEQMVLGEKDVERILPLYINGVKRNLNIVTMTGQDVVDVLESVVFDTETFFYPSGINVEYMPTAPFEQRITKVSNPDGTSFDLDKTYKVAMMGESISPENYSEIIVEDDSVDDVVTEGITKAKTIRPANDGQFVIVD